MPSPVIPLEALLELRRLLDSIQAAETRCERPPVVQEAAPVAPPALLDRGRRQSPQAEKSKDELQVFQ